MKSAVILIGLFFAYVAADELEDCPVKKVLEKQFEECAKSMEATEETIQRIREEKGGEDTTEVKCFRACMMKGIGLMENAKVNIEKLEELLKSSEKLTEEKRNMIIEMMKECQTEAEVSEDDCEVAENYYRCIRVKVKAMESKE